MGAAVQGFEQVCCVCPYLGENLHGGGSGGSVVWVGYVGDDTVHWDGLGCIPPHGGPQDDGTTTLERVVRWVGVSPTGRSDGGRGSIGGRDLSIPQSKNSCTVHCDQDHYVPVYGVRYMSNVTGVQAVVGIGQIGLGRDADGVLGGVMD